MRFLESGVPATVSMTKVKRRRAFSWWQ